MSKYELAAAFLESHSIRFSHSNKELFREAAALLRQQGQEWISVEERPLFKKIDSVYFKGWEATDDGSGEFLAAVPYHDAKDGTDKWWLRHCVLEDDIGLCVVSEDENIPAGWDMADVTHYHPLPPPPNKK